MIGLQCIVGPHNASMHSLVPRPIPGISMLHTENREGLVREIMCMMPSCHVTRAEGHFVKLHVLNHRL